MLYDPETKPSSEIGGFVNAYWNDYLNYWELQNRPEKPDFTDQELEQLRRLDRLGGALRASVHQLSLSENARAIIDDFYAAAGLAPKGAERMKITAHALSYHPLVIHCIQTQLAFEAVDELLHTSETRIFSLLALLGTGSVSPAAARYLDRATRLYLWGFDPECIMMCHSVLEAALRTWIEERATLIPELRVLAAGIQAYKLVDAAGAAGLLSPAEVDTANRLRKARNQVVHGEPTCELSAEEAVQMLATLLSVLFPSG